MHKKHKLSLFLTIILFLFIISTLTIIHTLPPLITLRKNSEFRNLNLSEAEYSNVTVISDGYAGIYWNDGDSSVPDIAVDDSGGIHVVWHDETNGEWGTDEEIMYANYTEATGWSNVTVISDGYAGIYWNDGYSSWPSIAVDNSGGIHAVWQDSTNGEWGTDSEIMYANYTNADGWSNVSVISDGYAGIYWNDDYSSFPSIAVDNSGGIHVVWHDDTNGEWGTDFEIMYANYLKADGWSNPTVISDGYAGIYWNDGISGHPKIAVDNSGGIHVVWYDYTNGAWGTDEEIMFTSVSISATQLGSIPFGNFYLIIMIIGTLGLIVYLKRKL